ncbi:STAS domain-containing protein [Actinoplanes sp. CA-142083]|uniref:STAS domain-containing protein n=1 Tax=Actinoplanes sp. CA-142083 TaxID=3239903 RepID=UPI003D8CEDEE
MESSIQRTLADDGTATVTVYGEIDFANCDELAGYARDAIREWAPTVLRIDLERAAFIDTTGLGALIEGYKEATAAGARFAVVNPTPSFRRVLDVTGLSTFFGLTDEGVETEATGT